MRLECKRLRVIRGVIPRSAPGFGSRQKTEISTYDLIVESAHCALEIRPVLRARGRILEIDRVRLKRRLCNLGSFGAPESG